MLPLSLDFLLTPAAPEKIPYKIYKIVILFLIRETETVALRIVQIISVLVSRMREQIQPQRTRPVELHIDVQIPDHLSSRRSRHILPVSDSAVHDHPVVEQSRGNRHVENVRTACILLIIKSKVDRDIQLLKNIVQLVRHDIRDAAEHRGRVRDTGLLIRQETVRHKQRNHLFLNLILRVQCRLDSGLRRRIQIRDIDTECKTRTAQPVSNRDTTFHSPSRSRSRVRNQRSHRRLRLV